MGSRNFIFIAAALLLGFVAVIIANAYFSGVESNAEREARERQLARIVVATAPLEFGSPLTPDNIALKT